MGLGVWNDRMLDDFRRDYERQVTLLDSRQDLENKRLDDALHRLEDVEESVSTMIGKSNKVRDRAFAVGLLLPTWTISIIAIVVELKSK